MLIREIPGLREEFVDTLEEQGYSTLYPPQEEALKSGILNGENLVLATPTASGKTLVAMIAAMRTIDKGGKVVYLAPLRALASEKYEEFKQAFAEIRKNKDDPKSLVKVFISTGDFDSSGESLGKGDILILTNERFDSVLRHGVTWTDSVGLFITDEVHLVGEDRRGPTLEVILAKIIRYAPSSQILALSATISNTEDLAKWLHARLIDTEWRPVKLIEGIYDYGMLQFVNEDAPRKIFLSNRGAALDVAIDSVKSNSGQALIFCETRKRAVAMAEKAGELTRKLLTFDDSVKLRELAQRIYSTGEETDVSKRLAEYISQGAAFHHAGLDSKHRKIVEDAFKNRQIKILTCTPTLAAGVNLPARRVVLSSLMRYDAEQGGQTPISVLEFKQMAGRAGRPKYDKVGEIVLLAGPGMRADEIAEHYINGEPEPIRSKLSAEGPLRSHILGLVSSQRGMNENEIDDFFDSTLFGAQYKSLTIESRIKKALTYLEKEGLVLRRSKKYIARQFGKRVAFLYIDPESAIVMRRGIRFAEKGKPHTLGLLHLVTQTPDMTPKFGTREKDNAELDKILEERESELLTPIPDKNEFSFYQEYEELLGEFRTVLALNSWIDENPEQYILEKYSIEPGDLHRMVDNADWLLYSLGELASLFGRVDLALEADEIRQRVRYGIRKDLIELTKLEGIGRVRARSLYNSGYRSIAALTEAPIEKLANVPKIGNAVANQIKNQLK